MVLRLACLGILRWRGAHRIGQLALHIGIQLAPLGFGHVLGQDGLYPLQTPNQRGSFCDRHACPLCASFINALCSLIWRGLCGLLPQCRQTRSDGLVTLEQHLFHTCQRVGVAVPVGHDAYTLAPLLYGGSDGINFAIHNYLVANAYISRWVFAARRGLGLLHTCIGRCIGGYLACWLACLRCSCLRCAAIGLRRGSFRRLLAR